MQEVNVIWLFVIGLHLCVKKEIISILLSLCESNSIEIRAFETIKPNDFQNLFGIKVIYTGFFMNIIYKFNYF